MKTKKYDNLLAEQSRAEQSRAAWISTLRGLAALLVFISHLKIDVSKELLFITGRIGVVLFLLMTGYLTYQSRIKRNVKQYSFNRFVRMYPVYWVLLIIGYPVLALSRVSFTGFLLNFTLFEEFLGVDTVLGASWMMPIQVCFFVIVAALGVKSIAGKGPTFIMLVMCVASVISGGLRNITGKPFPTAFPLLIMVAFLGISYFHYSCSAISLREILVQLIIFEFGLVVGAFLSYDNWPSYLVAYNVGIVIFIVASRLNRSVSALNWLGGIGFSFFLGTGIIYQFFVNFGICHSTSLTLLDCVIKFATDVLLAYVVTRFVEHPLLRKCKAIEKALA